MKNLDLKPIFQGLRKVVTENSSKILLWVGISCSISAIATSVPATVKAVKLVEMKKEEKNVKKLTFWETVKTTWYCYIPPVVLGTLSVVCTAKSVSIESKKTAALAAAYQITASAFDEYKDQVVQEIGEKKEQKVQDNIARKRIEDRPLSENNVIITGGGESLCFDSISGRYFRSSVEKINRSINDLNREMLSSGTISLSELYYELGLDPTSISDRLGWSTERGLIEVKYSSHLAENNNPCLVLDYRIYPKEI